MSNLKFEKCFIMLCTDSTEKECLQRNLFGDQGWRLQYLVGIKPGDIGFLLNTSRNELIGIFKACSEPQLNIEPDAWGGRFPAQIKVELISEIQRIPNATSIFQQIGIKMTRLPSGALVPRFSVHTRDVGEKILTYFSKPITIEKEEIPEFIKEFVKTPEKTFEDVIGLDDIKEFIKKRIINPTVGEEEVQKYRLRLGGGLLLYGPPGTGKTIIAEATAKEIDAKFVPLSPSIILGYPGEPEKRIEELFEALPKIPRVVVFLDEAEALLASRMHQTSTVMQRITSLLLSQFTYLSRHRFKPIFIIAATNMPEKIDIAFLRPGRFDEIIRVNPPNEKDRIDLLQYFLKQRDKSIIDQNLLEVSNKMLENLAKELEGYTGADIEYIIDKAARKAFDEHVKITFEIIRNIISECKSRGWPRPVDEEEIKRYIEWEEKFRRSI